MSNETIISLIQNQLADLEVQLSHLQHRAESIRSTISSMKNELANVESLHNQAAIQAQAAHDLAQSALLNAQQASTAIASQRDEMNNFIEHTAQQIESLSNKAMLLGQQSQKVEHADDMMFITPIDDEPLSIAEEQQISHDMDVAREAMVEQDAAEEQAIEDIEPEPIDQQPLSDDEENAIVADMQHAQESIATEDISDETEEPNVEQPIIDVTIEEVAEDSVVEQEPEDVVDEEPIVEEPVVESQAPIAEKVSKSESSSEQTSIVPKITDIKAGISIGDRFLFQRQLFKNSGELMNKTIAKLNDMSSFDEAMAYCEKNFVWDKESNAYELFTNVLHRRW